MSFYRKYRPQTFSELDSLEMGKRLGQLSSSPNLPHAMLFAGPKGTGKTSAARIVAKLINCTNPQTKSLDGVTIKEPCNTCDACVAITQSRYLDVFEIDAASNRGIEEIRDLREKIRLSPTQGKYKLYIIDEVHMLTTEAFNALLKTLEEPPTHAVFILATTDPEKLPATILSRCSLVRFVKANKKDIIHALRRVAKGESIDLGDDAFEFIADLSDGSFRDGTKMLEQSVAEGAKTLPQLHSIFGKSSTKSADFIALLHAKKSKDALMVIEDLREKGSDARLFLVDILNYLHAQLLANHGIQTHEVVKNDPTISSLEISNLIKLFLGVYPQLKTSSSPYLPLLVAVVEWCEKK
jgi:DNA polymerase-3 subunit gamma/tau